MKIKRKLQENTKKLFIINVNKFTKKSFANLINATHHVPLNNVNQQFNVLLKVATHPVHQNNAMPLQ